MLVKHLLQNVNFSYMESSIKPVLRLTPKSLQLPILTPFIPKNFKVPIQRPLAFIFVALTALSLISSNIHAEEIKTFRGSGFKVQDKEANLLEYPQIRQRDLNHEKEWTLGDLHGNGLKLVYFLLKEKLAYMSEEDYSAFCSLYLKEISELSAHDLESIKKLISSLKFYTIPADGMIRFLGDEFCDRGQNDYYVLKLFEHMAKEGIPFEILFSNHGYELISCFEKGLLGSESYLESIGCGTSLTHLKTLIVSGLVSMSEVDALIKEIYFPRLKLLSYSLSKESVTLYSHALIGPQTVSLIAASSHFGMPYSSCVNLGLVKVIDKVNAKFQEYLRQGVIFKTFDREIHARVEQDFIPKSLPIKRCIWNRGVTQDDPPVNKFAQKQMFYVHGHDGGGQTEVPYRDFVINLDNYLGKGPGNEKRVYTAYVIQGDQ